jgi:hypothetical protein
MILYSLLDWDGAGWYYSATGQTMLRTFWGQFGWGHVALLGPKPYRLLAAVTMMGVLGALVAFRGKPRAWPWDALIFWAAAGLLVWGIAVVRGAVYIFNWPFIPGARYAYPVVIPTLGLLCLGWFASLEMVAGWLGISRKTWLTAYVAAWVALDGLAIASILSYYRG